MGRPWATQSNPRGPPMGHPPLSNFQQFLSNFRILPIMHLICHHQQTIPSAIPNNLYAPPRPPLLLSHSVSGMQPPPSDYAPYPSHTLPLPIADLSRPTPPSPRIHPSPRNTLPNTQAHLGATKRAPSQMGTLTLPPPFGEGGAYQRAKRGLCIEKSIPHRPEETSGLVALSSTVKQPPSINREGETHAN